MTRVLALVGPTAAGKSRVALEVAEGLGAEIVSIDSMQVYRGMDVGTDKATPAMRARVPHHLLDLKDPTDDLTVAEFQTAAREAIAEIDACGRTPLLVGGSGLYFRAVVDDLVFPPRSPSIRSRFEERAEKEGPRALYLELQSADPVAAARIEPSNTRRVVRALEVIELTGRRFSASETWSRYESIYELRVAGLSLDRTVLYERIAQRVHEMLDAGLIDEARRVAAAGMGSTARQALGYKQILDAGADADPAALQDEIVRATKRFARRQLSWFRGDPRLNWFEVAEEGLVERLKAFYAGSGALP